LSPEWANLAYEMGLNVSKTCENALKEAIRRLQGANLEYDRRVRNAEAANSNPARSTITASSNTSTNRVLVFNNLLMC